MTKEMLASDKNFLTSRLEVKKAEKTLNKMH